MNDMEPDERRAVRRMADSLVVLSSYAGVGGVCALLSQEVADDVRPILKNTEIDYEECVSHVDATLVRLIRRAP